MNGLEIGFGTLAFLVALALAFDFMNGLHDAANSIATVVSTGVLKPHHAVAFAAFFNFVAIFVFQLKVAATVGKGIVDPAIVDHYVIFGALVGAIAWNGITWWCGAALELVARAHRRPHRRDRREGGLRVAHRLGHRQDRALHLRLARPGLPAGLRAHGARVVDLRGTTTPARIDRWFRRLQLVSAALYSLGHGGNDAQKTIGIIWLLLIAAGASGASEPVPAWVIVSCYVSIALGTLFGGWRIVKTMGQRITKLKPVDGFCAETGGAITLFVATGLGIPVSTTHTITGAIVGVGSTRKMSAVRWGVAGNIVWAWIFTIPATAFISAVAWWGARSFF